MLKSVTLFLYLISASQSFTNLSVNTDQASHYLDNNSLNDVERLIVQQDSSTTEKEKFPTIKKEGFVFQYLGCNRLSSDLVKCDFTVNNTQQRRQLTIFHGLSRIIDDAGNELKGSDATLGAEKASPAYVINELSTDVPMNGSITFRGPIGSNIRLFDISTGAFSFHVEFINK